MLRLGIAGFVFQLFTEASAAPTLSPADARRVAKQGFQSPTLVFDGAVKIVSAKKAGQSRLVIVTAKAVVDAGAVEAGTLAVAEPASHGSSMPVGGLAMLEVSYQTPRANQGSHTAGTIWLVRDDGSLACKVSGSSYDTAGTACGSSGSTRATPKLGTDGSKMVLDVRYQMSGNWSEPDKHGGCLHRSPVRHAKVERWIVPARGTCKAGTAPNGGRANLNDDF